MEVTTELNTSELGTIEFWDNRYSDEIKNFKDHGDVGEVWFGGETSKRIVKWLSSYPGVHKCDKLLDLGCGNGMLLVNLSEAGFTNLVGVDYSENAIELAKNVTREHNVSLIVGSILEKTMQTAEYDIAVDKGTYDAISLDPADSSIKRKIYIENVADILKPSGLFLLTSCNWTEDELLQQFSTYFEVVQVLPAPKFQFGGKSGSTVTSVALCKRMQSLGSSS